MTELVRCPPPTWAEKHSRSQAPRKTCDRRTFTSLQSRHRSTRASSPISSHCDRLRSTIGQTLKKGDIVVYEFTVYPGVTEDVCIPVLEKASGLKWKADFNVGYSPERINPGDKERRFDNILKIVSADTPETLDIVDAVYKSVVTAGTHRASSIRVAEFAKVLENTQRDINIALINEVALISDRLGIDTRDVLEAAGTKWNFLPFKPGLVGGHCIGVDPFYIAHKAEEVGYHPHVIQSGRRVNDSMGMYVANRVARSIMRRAGNGDRWSRCWASPSRRTCPTSATRGSSTSCASWRISASPCSCMTLTPTATCCRRSTARPNPLEKLLPADAVVLAVAHASYCKGGWDLVKPLLKRPAASLPTCPLCSTANPRHQASRFGASSIYSAADVGGVRPLSPPTSAALALPWRPAAAARSARRRRHCSRWTGDVRASAQGHLR